MKLLLTSAGITTKEIKNALRELTGRAFEKLRVAYIPTAMHPEGGDKHWAIKNLQELVDLKFKEIDIVDLAVLSKEQWLPRLEAADVIMVGGGFEGYLLRIMQESGFNNEIEKLLEKRVYVGNSAGAMATTPSIDPKVSEFLYAESQDSNKITKGLSLVSFSFFPHFNNGYFNVKENVVEKLLKNSKLASPAYLVDDNSALQIVDDEIKKVGKGVVFMEN